jgi:glycosyltransferase involved in cell wall biosynthesis
MRVSLVSRDNGVGLTHDMGLLRGLFEGAGHTVRQVDWRSPRMDTCDVAIFLELFNPNLARYARGMVGVFNLEWFMPRWRSYLPRFKQLWAKSREAESAYLRMGLRNVHHTGFLSRDMLDLSIPRQQRVLHLAGHSKLKNTEAVIRAWRDTPWLPPLTIVSVNDYAVPDGVALLGRQTDDALKELMNSHAIHLCPSRTEGWGHYIAEGMSVGATVITTDASPMNEHIRPSWGLLIPPASSTPRGRVEEHHIAPKAIAAAVEQAASLSHGEREQLGAAARVHFEGRNAQFSEQALRLLRRI